MHSNKKYNVTYKTKTQKGQNLCGTFFSFERSPVGGCLHSHLLEAFMMWPIAPGGLRTCECESGDTTAGGFLDVINSRTRAGDQRV